MPSTPELIRFTTLFPSFTEETVVERVSLEQVDTVLAQSVVGLIRDSYAEQFADTYHLVERIVIEASYNPANPAHVAAMREHMVAAIQKQSEYWIVRDFIAKGSYFDPRLIALTKITPKELDYDKLVEIDDLDIENAYIGDILVAPEYKRNHIGTMLLYAALRYSVHNYQSSSDLLVDGFVGNKIPNDWLVKLGLQPDEQIIVPPFVFRSMPTDITIQQQRYTTLDEGRNVGSVINALHRSMIQTGIAQEIAITS